VSTFAHLKHVRCLTTPYEPFDIGIIGAPFDTAVSYRPGMLFFSLLECSLFCLRLSSDLYVYFVSSFSHYHSIYHVHTRLLTFFTLPFLQKYVQLSPEVTRLLTPPNRRTLWPARHPSSISPPNHPPRLQHPRRHQPLHLMATHLRLR
jgi:hypothetical protein